MIMWGFAVIAAFAAGMWVMKHITLDYEDRIIDAVKDNEERKRQERRRRQTRPEQRKPIMNQQEYDQLMRTGHFEKRG